MGRNKIKIEKITNERTRLATFNKRKNGLVKKAMELAILCGCEVALIVIGNNKLTQYSSSDMDQLLLRYTDGGFEEPHAEPLTSDDYPKLFGKKNKANLVGTCTSTKESPAKKPRVESPTPLQSASHAMVKPLAPAHHDGRNSPSAAPGATLVPRGPSPPLGVKPVSPPAGAFAPGQGARLAAAPQQQLASPSYPSPYMGGYPATRTSTGGQFPSQSSSPSRSTIPPSLYSVPSTLNSTTPGGRISPPQRGSFGSAGSVSPSFEGGKPQSPRSNPPTPPGSGGHYAEEMRRASAGRLHQEQQFTLKVNKKNLSLAIPDPSSVSSAAANGFPGSSSSAGHSRHNIYSPGFTGLNVPSGVPFMGSESDMAAHSAILPSPSAFFAGEGTPGSHPESAGHYASSSWGGWLSSSSPRHHEPLHQHQQPFLSRDLNLALHDGTLHQQLSFGKQIPYAVGDKRKAQ